MRDFITGVRYFGQGFGLLLRRPRLLLIGMLPAVLTTVVLLGAMIALIANVGHLAALVTPFANGWPSGGREFARLAAGVALVGVALLLGIVGFTAVTLTVGGPFYEHIAEQIEDDLGVTAQRLELPWGRQFGRVSATASCCCCARGLHRPALPGRVPAGRRAERGPGPGGA